ncbi:MAG: hypothetical protein K2W85_12900 [Phycisphaerales bacterium]|nr:hypothetical protein [Phycisphaerales bacterium]
MTTPTRPDLRSIQDDAYRVAEAKRQLLDWGVSADAELKQQLADLREAVVGRARKARPWGVAMAAGAGLIGAMLLRKGKRRRGDGPRDSRDERGGRGLPIGQIIGIARVLAPIVLPMILKRR